MKKININVFDFDGTLIKDDSIKLYSKWLSYNLLDFFFTYHIKFRLIQLLIPRLNLKHERVKFYFARQIKLNKNIKQFNDILKDNLFEDSLELLKKDNSKNQVFIVSASFFEILNDFCKNYLKVKLLTNKLESFNNLNDVNGRNKINALNCSINTSYKINQAYGNSSGDFEFMNISEKPFLRLKNGKIIKWQM